MNIYVSLVIAFFFKSSHQCSPTVARDASQQTRPVVYIVVDRAYSQQAIETASIRALETQLDSNAVVQPELKLLSVDRADFACDLPSKFPTIHLAGQCLPPSLAQNTPVLSFPVGRTDNASDSSVAYASFARDSKMELPVVVAFASKMNWTSAVFVGDTRRDAFLERLLRRKRTFDLLEVISVDHVTNATRLYSKVASSESDFVLLHCHSCACSDIMRKLYCLRSKSRGKESWVPWFITETETHRIQGGGNCEPPATHWTKFGLQVAVQYNSLSDDLLQEVPFLHRMLRYGSCIENRFTTSHQQLQVLDFFDSLIVVNHLLVLYHHHNLLNQDSFPHVINKAQLQGIRGTIQFDSSSTVIYPALYKILDISQFLVATVGIYDSQSSEWVHELRTFDDVERASVRRRSPRRASRMKCAPANRFFRVTTIVEPPFLIYDPNGKHSGPHHGNYTGIVIDMLEWLAEDMGITYTISEQDDGKYGTVNETGYGNGMVGELMKCKADLAAAAFAITVLRSQHIQFTKSYIDVGYTLLRHKDEELDTEEVWAFLKPFDLSTNVVVVVSFIVVWILFMAVQKISPCVNSSDSEVDKNGTESAARVAEDSMWLLYASAMQQGPENVPSLSGKLIVAGWFFFCLVIISTYTANLAAFLTVRSFKDGVDSLDDLAAQTEIVYGTVRDSSITEFFARSPIDVHKRMHLFMTNTEEALVDTAEEAYLRVRNRTHGEYFFIWDQPILEYVASHEPCNTEVVGRAFNPHGYGFAMPQGMPYESNFSLSILKMREVGKMNEFLKKWLYYGDCSSAIGVKDLTDVDKVHLTDLIGIFIILAVTTVAGFGLAAFQRLCCKRTNKHSDVKTNDVAVVCSVRNYDRESCV